MDEFAGIKRLREDRIGWPLRMMTLMMDWIDCRWKKRLSSKRNLLYTMANLAVIYNVTKKYYFWLVEFDFTFEVLEIIIN